MANNIQEINLSIQDYLPENMVISANWKNHTIRLNDLEEAANAIRVAKGEEPFAIGDRLKSFRRSNEIEAFTRSLERSLIDSNSVSATQNNNQSRDVSNYFSSPLIISKTGRYGGTWAEPMIALRFAAWLDPDLEVEIYKQFMIHKITERRDESAQGFNALRRAYYDKTNGAAPRHHYIQFSNAMQKKLNCTDWDTADTETLSRRTTLENQLATLLDSGIINTYNDVIEMIEKLKI